MIPKFIHSLKKTPKGLFNPWYHRDKKNDLLAEAPEIRRCQLEAYLSERVNRAKFLFIAEALGYQGGHFTGMAMTSERIILGHQSEKYGIKPDHVFKTIKPTRTSNPDLTKNGMSEPTATIMWGAIVELNMDPYDVVLWNAVPWHPFNEKKGLLSNRTPSKEELLAGTKHLKPFISLFGKVQHIVAVGKKCELSLNELGIPYTGVRHPANGGAPAFRKQLRQLMLKYP